MTRENLKTFENFWIQVDKYYLGPVDIFVRVYPDWGEPYGIYRQDILGYTPFFIAESDIRSEVIRRMRDAGCSIITSENIEHRKDITQLWNSRKNEFILRPRYEFRHELDYMIKHKLTGENLRIDDEAIIKLMIEAGVEISAE